MKPKFITNNEEIKNGLLELGIQEFSISSNSSQENRQYKRSSCWSARVH